MFTQRLDFQKAQKALILGLDGSGKSAVLAAVCGDRTEYSPTFGFHVLHLLIDKDMVEIWEGEHILVLLPNSVFGHKNQCSLLSLISRWIEKTATILADFLQEF